MVLCTDEDVVDAIAVDVACAADRASRIVIVLDAIDREARASVAATAR
jgi:hypothetical protein